jgi:diguanylate cyclase (GGDEF)-like protein/PAS domain S-box-containing protein
MSRAKILIVEDESIIAMDLRVRLTALGYTVFSTVSTGEAAIQLAETMRPDLVLMDIVLKGEMDGITAAEQIRKRFDIPVIYATAYSDDQTLQRARVAEPFGYVLKPFADRELVSAIEMALYKHATERQLRESEERFRKLVEQGWDGIVLLDAQGIVKYVSASIARVLGYPVEEMVGSAILGKVHPDDLPTVRAVLARAITQPGVPLTHAARLRHKDGGWRWTEIVDTNLMGDKSIQAIVLNIRDITERKGVEEALIASEVRYRRLFESAKDGILILDAETGMVVDVNPFLVERLGFSREQFLGKKIWELGFLKDTIANQDIFAELQRQGYVRYEDLPLETADGRRIDVEFVSNVYVVDHQKVIQCNIRDITEHKRAEAMLRESEEKYRTLFETMAQGVVYQNAAGEIISANRAAEHILGLSREQMQGRTSLDPRWKAVHEDGSDFPGDTHPAMVALRTGKEVRNIVMGVFHPQEKERVWININAVPQFKPGEPQPYQVFTTFEDITERKRAEEALRIKEQAIATSINAMVFSDLAGNLTYVNDSFLKMWGYASPKEVLARSALEFWESPDKAMDIGRVLQEGGGWIGEMVAKKKDGALAIMEMSVNLVTDLGGTPIGMMASFVDITERKHAEVKLLYLSTHDVLTGLYNRAFFEEEIARLERGREFPISVVMIDVNGMKAMNDTLGHAAGDDLLRRAAQVLKASFRAEDMVARIGGDEFAALLPNTDATAAEEVLTRIRHYVASHNSANHSMLLSLALGVATGIKGSLLTEVFKEADRRMYQDKSSFRDARMIDR